MIVVFKAPIGRVSDEAGDTVVVALDCVELDGWSNSTLGLRVVDDGNSVGNNRASVEVDADDIRLCFDILDVKDDIAEVDKLEEVSSF